MMHRLFLMPLAAMLSSFTRYSSALKSSRVARNDKTFAEWITPGLHPGDEMTFSSVPIISKDSMA
jgi:hypothetical protein